MADKPHSQNNVHFNSNSGHPTSVSSGAFARHSSNPESRSSRGGAGGSRNYERHASWSYSSVLELPHHSNTWLYVRACLCELSTGLEPHKVQDCLVRLYGSAMNNFRVDVLNNTPYFPLLTLLENSPDLKDRVYCLLPHIAKWALGVENIGTNFTKMMAAQRGHLPVPRKTVAMILSCSFLCILPEHSRGKHSVNFCDFFNTLHPMLLSSAATAGSKPKLVPNTNLSKQIEKLKFFLNYFEQIGEPCDTNLIGDITITRVVLGHTMVLRNGNLEHSLVKLCPVQIKMTEKIEETKDAILVDFANKHLGGGVMRTGSVQEEIMFLMCPELLIAMLLSEPMTDNEAILVDGFKPFATASGYSNTLKFEMLPPHTVSQPLSMCAIDALPYGEANVKQQYDQPKIMRDINKAYAGFLQPRSRTKQAVATGNWGSGAFGGDAQLKAVIQWIAASQAGLPKLFYHTYQRTEMSKFQRVIDQVTNANWNVSDLWKFTLEYCKDKASILPKTMGKDFFERLLKNCEACKKSQKSKNQ